MRTSYTVSAQVNPSPTRREPHPTGRVAGSPLAVPALWAVAAALLVATANPARAGLNAWTTGGPEGGYIEGLVIDPSSPTTVYAAATRAGIFRSTDGGATWQARNSGLGTLYVTDLALDPVRPNILFAAMQSRVYKTTDAGQSWVNVSAGVPSGSPTALTIDPTHSDTVWLGVYHLGLYRTTDGGASWSAASSGLSSTDIYGLAVDPTNGNVIYAGSIGGGVFKTTNGGGSWAAASTGLGNLNVRALAIDPSNTAIVYAATDGGVFKTTNGGGTWVATSTGLTSAYTQAIAVAPSNPSKLYVGTLDGVFASNDAGSHWASAVAGLTNKLIHVLAVHPTNPSAVYAGCYYGGGVFRSSDGGGTWTHTLAGMNGAWVTSLAAEAGGTIVYAGSAAGVARSTDAGATWQRRNTGLSSIVVNALALDPRDSQVLLAGTDDAGVFRTSDGGATWSPRNDGLTGLHVNTLALDPSHPDTLYAAASFIYRSTDGGAHWTKMGSTVMTVMSMVVDNLHPNTIYVGRYPSGVFKSTDAGATWSDSSSGLPSDQVRSLAIDRTDTGTIYAGTLNNGLFKSINGGLTWASADTGMTNQQVMGLAIDPADRSTLYAGTTAGLFVTNDGAATWSEAPGSGLLLEDIKPIAVSHAARNLVFAGSQGRGVFVIEYSGGTCTLTCTAPVPLTASTGIPVWFATTGSGCPGPITYEWDFGDGSAHSSLQYTGHVYSSAGSYGWKVNVKAGSQTCTRAGTIAVAGLPPASGSLVPAIAHVSGYGGTPWRSDLAIVNPGPLAATATLTYTSDSVYAITILDLPVGATREWRNVLETLYALPSSVNTSGTMYITSNTPLLITSRNYADMPSGTYGQYFPALVAAAGVGPGEIGILPQLKSNSLFYTNVGVVNLGTAPCTVRIRLFDLNGAGIGSVTDITLEPRQWKQANKVFDTSGAGARDVAYGTVEVLTSGGLAWAYGAIMDQRSKDPTTIPMLVP